MSSHSKWKHRRSICRSQLQLVCVFNFIFFVYLLFGGVSLLISVLFVAVRDKIDSLMGTLQSLVGPSHSQAKSTRKRARPQVLSPAATPASKKKQKVKREPVTAAPIAANVGGDTASVSGKGSTAQSQFLQRRVDSLEEENLDLRTQVASLQKRLEESLVTAAKAQGELAAQVTIATNTARQVEFLQELVKGKK